MNPYLILTVNGTSLTFDVNGEVDNASCQIRMFATDEDAEAFTAIAANEEFSCFAYKMGEFSTPTYYTLSGS